MAKMTITLSGVVHYKGLKSMETTTDKIVLATGKETSEIFIAYDKDSLKMAKYRLALTDLTMHKKMYQPTEIIAKVSIVVAEGENTTFNPINRKVVESMFKHAKVTVSEGNFNVGDNFYVFEVLPQYFEKSMAVTLKIYSLDKLMTLQETSRTFVGMRLGADILKTEAVNYVEPDDNMKKSQAWINANEELIKEKNTIDGKKDSLEKKKNGDDAKAYEEAVKEELDDKKKIADLEQDLKNATKYTGTTIKVNIDNMKTLVYVDQNAKSSTNGLKCEHIHHYLVQYNESFYDMLARTCNRWGEFLYYENGELTLGYNDKKAPIDLAGTGFKSISFFDLNSKDVSASQKGKYELEADNSSLRGFSLEESPFIPKGQFGYFDERHKVDKWIMKQFPAIFKNDKNLPTMLTNIMFDNLFSLAMAKSSTAKLNSDADEKYFANYNDDTKDQHYGTFDFANAKKAEPKREKNAFQQFSELYTNYNEKGYSKILQKELSVGENAIHIDYETTFPKLKLGDIITYNGENFIVVEIKSRLDSQKGPVFEVVATVQDSKDKLFYPAMIPSGHVRYAHPQEATITDAKDPTGFNRVRVLFNWQKEYIKYEDELNKPKGCVKATVDMSTPWLTFASSQQGAPVTGYHYVGYPVMVGFVDGNVERPYVMGGISDDFVIADSVMQTEGGQRLQISDGFGNGMTAFLSGIFSPLLKTFTGFVPGLIPSWDWKKSRRFEGGFELTDYYGIYKVSGSTDGRNVTVASPWGDVKINAFTGINISAPNGDVKISGKNVTIEAGNNLKLVSGTNVNYKLWKSKDTKKGTVAQIALDMSAQVAKKITEIAMSAIDLSLVRSTVEIFFRPVEGSLTVKSNRYLKLESGNSSCQYPEAAYNVEKKRKLLDEINKETIIETTQLGPGMVDIFNMLAPVSNIIVLHYVDNYNRCVSALREFNRSFLALKLVSTGLDEKPCKTFEDLRDDLLGQDANKKWDAGKLAFSDSVKIDGKPTKILTATEADKIAAIIGARGSYKEVAKQIIAKRKQAREDILMKLNKLRKSMYHLTHPVDKEYVNSYFSKHHDNDMPKDYKKKVITAFSKQKCPNAYIYRLTDEDKKFAVEKAKVQGLVNDMKYMRRLVALNLLEEFGFTDATRKKVVLKPIPAPPIPPAPAALPLKPKTDTMDASDPLNIMNSSQWENYVSSLSGVPAIGKDKTTIGETLKAATWGTIKDKFKNNIAALYYAKKEHDTWGEGKNGQILFASGKGTVALKNNQLEAVTGIAPTYKSMNSGNKELDKKEQETLEKFVDQIRRCLMNL